MIVKAKKPVRYNGVRYEAGTEFEVSADDYKLHAGILVVVDGGKAEITPLEDMTVAKLKAMAAKKGVDTDGMKKADLIAALKGADVNGGPADADQ